MAEFSATTMSESSGRTRVRIVVAGDPGTGKSSLILTDECGIFPVQVPPVLPPSMPPVDFCPADRLPITIIDTSSSAEDSGKVAEELKQADVVVLTYACDQPRTVDRLSTFWLPKLRQLEVKAPVIVVGCKLDLRDKNQPVSMEQVMSTIMQQFQEIETCIACSASEYIMVEEVFYHAQRAVHYPAAPLLDLEKQTLGPRCVGALEQIFTLLDHDKDGALSDAELNDFQIKCFNFPLAPSDIECIKKVVQGKLPAGVDARGITSTGFLYINALLIEKGQLETTWTILRKFGYNNELKLSDDVGMFPS